MSTAINQPLNTVVDGDCVEVMRQMKSALVEFTLTDPPYLCSGSRLPAIASSVCSSHCGCSWSRRPAPSGATA